MKLNIKMFLNELRSNTLLYSCFIIFGIIIGKFNLELINTILICSMFCITVICIEFQDENYHKGFNWILDNLYIVYISILFAILNVNIVDFAIIGVFIILSVTFRGLEIKRLRNLECQ
jgi:hypothetical protein